MNNLLERIGLPLLVQISIECWNELLLLLLIFAMVLSTRRDRSGGGKKLEVLLYRLRKN